MKVTDNGIVYELDDETGEVLSTTPVEAKFAVTDEKSAEWVLERLQEQDASIAALNARESAILENIRSERRRIENRREGLLYRFKGELEAFARENLPQGKKSWVCPYGTVAFRRTAARLKVADPEKALEWAEKMGYNDAIKTVREFQISKLDDSAKDAMMIVETSTREAAGLDISPETESVSIKTGVE